MSALLRKTWGTRRGDILVPLFAAVAFAGLRWGRNRRGDFQSPRGSGGRKTPTPFHAGFRRTGAGGGAPEKNTGHPRRGDILVPLFAAVAFAGLRWGRNRRGDFQSPRGSGGRKTPTPFHAGLRRTGAGGGAPEKNMGHPRRGDILVPLFAAVAFAGLRWGRNRRGDFQSPRGSGGRKTPTPFDAGFRRTEAGGGAPEKNMGHPRRGDVLVPLFAAVAFAGLRWGRNRRGDFQSPRGSGGRKTPTPLHAGFRRTGAGGEAPEKNMGHPEGGHSCPPLRCGCFRRAPVGPE